MHHAPCTIQRPLQVIAYLMKTYCLDFKAALGHVQQKRFCVQPNDGFEQQLREFEPIYRAR
jgi:serine/threonine/tyrosine-interacting protein